MYGTHNTASIVYKISPQKKYFHIENVSHEVENMLNGKHARKPSKATTKAAAAAAAASNQRRDSID